MYAISHRVDSITMVGASTTVLPALLGVEEDSPRAEVAGLDDLAQLVLALDEREIGLRHRALERCENVGVRIGGGLGGCEL